MEPVVEVWSDIAELPLFEVSNLGNMRSKDGTFYTSAKELREISKNLLSTKEVNTYPHL